MKILLCGGASFAAAKMIYPLTAFLAGGMVLTLLRLCIAAAPAGVLYLVLAYLLRVEEMQTAVNAILRKKG